MKHSKNGIYALIAATAFGLYGCDKEEPVQRTAPVELVTNEISDYAFERLALQESYGPFGRNAFNSGLTPVGVTCGDLDNDGDLEIIVASHAGIAIYKNNHCKNKARLCKIERD